MKILIYCSTLDFRYRMGCTPSWWQLFKALYESGNELIVPCLTLPKNTERPERIWVGSNVLVWTRAHEILSSARPMFSRPRTWKNPCRDGMISRLIVTVCDGIPSRNNYSLIR